eukprot:SAG22_NODE_188_length_15821_cov_38.313319_16_plen_88_part_00
MLPLSFYLRQCLSMRFCCHRNQIKKAGGDIGKQMMRLEERLADEKKQNDSLAEQLQRAKFQLRKASEEALNRQVRAVAAEPHGKALS